jgi:ubiquinone biosynthesis protein
MIINEAKNLGVTIPTENLPSMRRDLKEIVDAYYGRTLGEVSIDIIGREFLNLIYKYKVRIPQQYALLAKALITVEGVAKKLYPQINIIEVAKPYVMELMRQKFGPEKMVERVLEESKTYAFQLFDFPRQLYFLVSSLKRGDFQIRYRQDDLKEVSRSIKLSFNRLIIALYLASFLLLFPLVAFLFPGRSLFLLLYTLLYFVFFLILLFFLRRE